MTSIGLSHFTFLDIAPKELVKLARQSGFDFVGMRFHPVSVGDLHYLPNSTERKELAHIMAGEGIALYDVETIVITECLQLETLKPALDVAAELGARRVNVCADCFEGLIDRFAQICALASERGLGVDIECMAWRGVSSPKSCLDIIQQSEVKNACYLMDTLHHIRCGGTIDEIVNMPLGSIVSAQICDAPLVPPRDPAGYLNEARRGRRLPGDGALPLTDLISALPNETVVSVEIPSATDTCSPLERACAIYSATSALLKMDT